MRSFNIIAAAAALLAGSAIAHAHEADCNCAVYLATNSRSAMVIDNVHGWIDEVIISSPHVNDPNPVLGTRKHFGERDEMQDCSRDGIVCAELRSMNLKLAAKTGSVGDTYKIDDVTFRIRWVGTFPHERASRLFAIDFEGPKQLGSFVYSQQRGVVMFTDDCVNTSAAASGRESCARDYKVGWRWQATLIEGEGLLAPQGYPAAHRKP